MKNEGAGMRTARNVPPETQDGAKVIGPVTDVNDTIVVCVVVVGLTMGVEEAGELLTCRGREVIMRRIKRRENAGARERTLAHILLASNGAVV